jgi:predicted dehydrogenase
MIWLTRSYVEEVSVWTMDDVERYRGDNFAATLRFADGSLGLLTYTANGSRQSGKERVEIYCAGHTIVLDDFTRLEIARPGRFRPERIRAWTADKGHAEECRLTVGALLAGKPVPIPIGDILHSSLVTLMAHESLCLHAPVRAAGSATHARLDGSP